MEIFCTLLCSVLFFTCSYALLECGQPNTVFTAPNGSIKSHAGFDFGHNYGKGLHCVWHIRAPVGSLVELNEDSFDVEGSGTSCTRDYLTLYDGPGTNSSEIGRYCGSSFPTQTSSGRDLTIAFTTNTYTTRLGFKLIYNFTTTFIRNCPTAQYKCTNNKCVPQNYRCDNEDDCGDDSDEHHCPPFTCLGNKFPCQKGRKCINSNWLCDGDSDCADGSDEKSANCNGGAWKCGNLINNGTQGTIQTPGFPITLYPNNIDCKFEIFSTNPNATSITLSFVSNFHIEQDVSCAYDYVKVYSDGATFLHGPFCGNTAPSSFTVPAKHVIVEFNSDNSDNAAGFQVNWSSN